MGHKIIKCVNCGFCCERYPCPYGQKGDQIECCLYLTKQDDIGRRFCSIKEEIDEMPGSEWCPAFGAGCSSPMFNSKRDQIVALLGDK